MKVLYLCPEYPPAPCGGIGQFYRTLAREAAGRGAVTCVIAVDPESARAARSREEGVDVLRLPGAGFAGPVLGWGSKRWDCGAVRSRLALRRAARAEIERSRPDLVETYDWSGPAPWKPAAPFVVRMHGASAVRSALQGRRSGRLLQRCERSTLAAADALVAVSSWIGARTVAAFGLRRAFHALPNGVDGDLFAPGPATARTAEILYVGSVREDKGVGLLLEAFAVVAARRDDIRLRLVGPLPEQGLEAPFLAQRLLRLDPSIRRRIRIDGRLARRDLPALYRRAALCAFPSRGEAHPLACLEAMSCGAAVVANAEGGMAETIEHEVSGLLEASALPTQWARRFEAILTSSALGERLGAGARERIQQRFALASIVDQNLAFYASVIRWEQARREGVR